MLCFIVSLVVGACIFLGASYLVQSEITDIFDVLFVFSFDFWFVLLVFLFAYAGLGPMLVE